MNHIHLYMFGVDNYLVFVFTGILLNITPGSDTIYIVTRSVAQGKKAGILSVLGISTGGLIHTLLAAFGLSLVLTTSTILFNIVKLMGAVYLIWLGIGMLRSKSNLFDNQSTLMPGSNLLKIFSQGVLTNVLNPKVALFFLSFLPQFIQPENEYGPVPFLILGGTFLVTGTLWCLIVAWSASFMTTAIRNHHRFARFLQKASGCVFILLGMQIALKRG